MTEQSRDGTAVDGLGAARTETGAHEPAIYARRRNLVRRADGRMVNVARSRGHLFVCSEACCCGRVEDGMAPVPVDLYHGEWERRRLRNVVHLTIGGCLGPCALANVVMLLFDGQALWFHSINSEPLVLALYDYAEAMLDADALLPPPESLAALQFTADTWQPRPDGQPVDDRRRRGDLTPRPPSLAGKGESSPAADDQRDEAVANQVGASQGGSQTRPVVAVPSEVRASHVDSDSHVPAEEGSRGVRSDIEAPRKNGELVFAEPWEGRAFGMAVALNEDACYPWEAFRQRLIAQIADADARDDPSGYYERWLAAFEDVLEEQGIISKAELDERTFEFEFGERDDVF